MGFGQALGQDLSAVKATDPVQAFGEFEGQFRRVAKGPHCVLDGGTGAVDLGDPGNGGVGPLIAPVHVVEYFLAPVVLEVDIDIGRFGHAVDPGFGQEPFEQESMLDRIDGGDAEAVRHGGVGGAPAALGQDVPLARESNRVPHHQKKAGIAQPGDDVEFMVDLGDFFGAGLAPPLPGSFEREVANETVIVVSRRHAEGRERRPDPPEVEFALVREGARGVESGLRSAPPNGHLVGREQHPLAVRVEQALVGGRGDGGAVAEGREDFMHQPGSGVDIAGVLSGEPGHATVFRQPDQRAGQCLFSAPRVVEPHFDGDPVPEGGAIAREERVGVGGAAVENRGGQGARGRPGQEVESLMAMGHLVPGEFWPAPGGGALGPSAEIADARVRDQGREVLEADGGPNQQGQRAAVHDELGPDDRPEALLAAGDPEPDDAAQVGAVGQADGVIA